MKFTVLLSAIIMSFCCCKNKLNKELADQHNSTILGNKINDTFSKSIKEPAKIKKQESFFVKDEIIYNTINKDLKYEYVKKTYKIKNIFKEEVINQHNPSQLDNIKNIILESGDTLSYYVATTKKIFL